VTELNVIAAQYREQTKRADATEAWTEMRSEWIDATVKRAVLLYEARRKFLTNQAFSDWLGENEIEIEKNTQAALIRMGEYPELTREGLEKTRRTSIQWIWAEELEGRFPRVRKSSFPAVEAEFQLDIDVMSVSERAAGYTKRKGELERGAGALDAAAKEFGFSRSVADFAVQVLRQGVPELIAAMDQGLAIQAAAAVSRLPVEQQRMIMALPEKDRRSAANAVRVKKTIKITKTKKASEPVIVETKGGYQITKVGNTVVLPSTGLPKFSNADLDIPDPSVANEPDPEQPGLTKGQRYVAKYGQGQLKTMRERKRSIVQGLGATLMKLDAPLTEFVETVLVTPAEVTELLSETNKPERTAERIKKGLDALRQSAAQLQQFIVALDALLAGQPDRDEVVNPPPGDDPVAVATTQPVREQVLALAKQRGAAGITRSDVLALFPRKEAGAKRLSELCREGYLIKTTKRRYNADGMPESVYVYREAQRVKPDQIVLADLLEATLH
jgi:hypothetical protein